MRLHLTIASRLIAAMAAEMAAPRRMLVSAAASRSTCSSRPATRPLSAYDQGVRRVAGAMLVDERRDPRSHPRRGAGARVRRGRRRRARLADSARANLAEFLGRGYHGEMGWLAAHAERRGDPRTLWPEARTVVVLGLNYGTEDEGNADTDSGIVSIYARPGLCPRHGQETAEGAGALDRRALAGLKVFVDTAQ